jgi:methylated-DNA-[protein]-cysteine S-methyltransferase
MDSPLGPLTVAVADGRITSLDWGRAPVSDDPVICEACDQLAAFFDGDRQVFDLPLASGDTEFQGRFYQVLLAIPYGETRTYGELAGDLNVSAQAIGQACGANRIPIIIPCHRVLAANDLGGYSGRGGVEAKVALLKLEGAASLLI